MRPAALSVQDDTAHANRACCCDVAGRVVHKSALGRRDAYRRGGRMIGAWIGFLYTNHRAGDQSGKEVWIEASCDQRLTHTWQLVICKHRQAQPMRMQRLNTWHS